MSTPMLTFLSSMVKLVELYRFSCNKGSNNYFFLWRCEKFIDKCLLSPCQHNSMCTPLINSYRCNCTAGYEGKLFINFFSNSMNKYLLKVKKKDASRLPTNIVHFFVNWDYLFPFMIYFYPFFTCSNAISCWSQDKN